MRKFFHRHHGSVSHHVCQLARAALGWVCLTGALGAHGKSGADILWTTIEAEDMRTSGTVLGPAYGPHRVEMESSQQKCVKLGRVGDYVEFTAPAEFNTLVVRYCLPDSPTGGGTLSELNLLINGQRVTTTTLTSSRAWLYGAYPFSNDPAQGKARNFYDELRLKDLRIRDGDVVRFEKSVSDVDCILDLIDGELAPAPLAQPQDSLSVMDFGASGQGDADDTAALRTCIARAQEQHRVVWVPAGNYRITGEILVPSAVRIQGAGMWHTTFVGDDALYGQADRRVRFKLTGTDMHIADFAILGRLNYRNDQEPNDGVVGAGCTNASITRIWVEHTKAGAWIYNGTNLVIDGCRFRNLLADGVNFCVGTNHSVVQNCTARGTGDDCYAMWPAPSDQGHDEGQAKPGNNVFRQSTGQLPFLANGGCLYGGADNRIEDCLFTDITSGCGILVSSTFPTADEVGKVDNNFSGLTVVKNVQLVRCGGYDHTWAWRAALQVCMDRRSISGLRVSGVEIRDSLSDGISVVAPGRAKGAGTLSNAVFENVVVSGVGRGSEAGRDLWIRADASGELTFAHSPIGSIRNESADFKIVVSAP